VTYANPHFLKVTGYSSEETIGQDWLTTFTPQEMRPDMAAALAQILGGVEHLHHENYVLTRDGEERLVAWNSTVLRGVNGELVGTMSIGEDITERKRASEALQDYSNRLEEMVEERTEQLRTAQERLARQEKLALLGQLAGSVGHELRNPLGAISNAVYLLGMLLDDGEPQVQEVLQILTGEVDAANQVISSLLDFGRSGAPAWQSVDINALVQDVLSRTAVPEGIEVAQSLADFLPTVVADPRHVQQMVGNLILNGIEAMPDGGTLRIRTAAVSEKWVTVTCTDSGVGISEENLKKIFEPLFTTKAKGIGLGLTLVRALAEAHGGSVEVQSQVGRGSSFTIKLPSRVEGSTKP
jgi:PAS domain S-box-containing protein